MSTACECPALEEWQALLRDGLPPEQQTLYQRHLESCALCQARLDEAEKCRDDLWRLGRQVGDPTALPVDPTLVQIIDKLHGVGFAEQHPGEPADLYFLAPSDQPGVLGMLGDYEVHAVIGQGGMGVVLKAYEPALHRMVAIKVMAAAVAGSATARRRFIREAQAAAAVCHDHIVAVHGVHETQGLPYLVMQYVSGESLQARLDRTGPLDVTEIVRIGFQTASGLAAAHAQGLIHRDIKPANLLLENGLARVKITDFGLARMVDDVRLTQSGVLAGTPEYMAPEQARSDPVDHRGDLFSLGSVLYAMCTGVPPFRGATTLAVVRRVNDETPAPIRSLNADIPAWLETLIMRLLAKDPAERCQSAAEVAGLLEGYLVHLRQPEIAPPPLPPAPRQRRSKKWLPAALGVLTASAAGLLGFFVLGAFFQDEPPAKEEPIPVEHHYSLHGPPEPGSGLELVGPDADQCRFEPEGLRLRVPAHAGGGRRETSLLCNRAVKGDFRITVRFDILNDPGRSKVGKFQTRLALSVLLDKPQWHIAALSRKASLNGQGEFVTWTSWRDEASDTNKEVVHAFPTDVTAGRLRLVRTGNDLAFYVAHGVEEEFIFLQQHSFSGEDIKEIRITGSTGSPTATLDVRLTDLSIRTGSLAGGPPSRFKIAGRVWLIMSLFVGLSLTLAATAVWRRVRRGGREGTPASSGTSPGQSEATWISFPCSGCGKKLKTKARLCGKKVKCPQCGAATQVVQTSTNVSETAPSRFEGTS